MALRVPRLRSKWFGTFTGQTSVHWLQAVHFTASTKRGWRLIVAMKLPGFPFRSVSSDRVSISTFKLRAHSTSFGETIHVAQSPVGNVLSRWDIIPPIEAALSIK